MPTSTASDLAQITANLSGKTRRATLQGREYLVAPVTMIVPGVLNGSRGPLYYPSDETERSAQAWNGMPIVVYHPKSKIGTISARAPEVLEKQGVGTLFNATFNGKLQAEAWFDIERTEKVDKRVLSNLQQNKPIELSTGLFTDNTPAENGANFNGRQYTAVARNHRPDHLAVLPDQIGACSLKDGCGVLVNEDEKSSILTKIASLLGISLNSPPSGTPAASDPADSDSLEIVPSSDGVTNYNSSQPRDSKGRFGSGGGGGAVGGKGASKAHGSSQEGAGVALPKDPKRLTIDQAGTALAEKGYKLGKAQFSFETKKTLYDVTYPNGKQRTMTTDEIKGLIYSTTKNERTDMSENKTKDQMIDEIIKNSCGDCYNEEDRETLNSLADNIVKGIHTGIVREQQLEAVVNAATKGFEDQQGDAHVFNSETNQWEVKPKDPAPTDNKKGGNDEMDDKKKEMTEEEWMAQAPPSVRNTLNHAKQVETEARGKLIEQITANEQNKFSKEELEAMTMPMLNGLASLAAKPQQQEAPKFQNLSMFGPTANRATAVKNGAKDETPLVVPTINWKEESKVGA